MTVTAGFISSSQLWYLFSLLDDVRWLYTSTYLCNNRLGLAVCVRLDTSQRIFVPDFFFFFSFTPPSGGCIKGRISFFFLSFPSYFYYPDYYDTPLRVRMQQERKKIPFEGGRIVSKAYAAIHPSWWWDDGRGAWWLRRLFFFFILFFSYFFGWNISFSPS